MSVGRSGSSETESVGPKHPWKIINPAKLRIIFSRQSYQFWSAHIPPNYFPPKHRINETRPVLWLVRAFVCCLLIGIFTISLRSESDVKSMKRAKLFEIYFLGLPKNRQGKWRPQRSDSPRWKNIGGISCQIIHCQIGNWLLERKDFSLEFLVGWWWCPWLSSLWKRLWPFSSEGKFSVASRSFATTAF